jgi:hypothetical protein
MKITLTREEAQQVLDALADAAGCVQENYQPGHMGHGWGKEIETLRARLSAPEPEYRDVVIKGDLWRIEFLPDHAASVVLVRANYEAQPEPPCKTGSQCIGGKCPQCVVSEPEPVAWMNESDMGRTDWKVWAHGKPTATMPLYPAQPQREWQGLTDEEIMDLCAAQWASHPIEVARIIEAKLKEKNT